MNLTFSFSVTTLLAIVISTATAQEQIYNQIHASRGATSGTAGGGGGSPFQHQHHDNERQQQQEQRAQQLRGGRGGGGRHRHPSALLLEAVKVDAGSCSNQCYLTEQGSSDFCCPGYTCQSVGGLPPWPQYSCNLTK